eukprot:SAG25_NODE_230_length_11432_cov_34.362481_15_plen_155_part_00
MTTLLYPDCLLPATSDRRPTSLGGHRTLKRLKAPFTLHMLKDESTPELIDSVESNKPVTGFSGNMSQRVAREGYQHMHFYDPQNARCVVALWRVCVVCAPRVSARKLTASACCGRAVLPELLPPPPPPYFVTPSPSPLPRSAAVKFHNVITLIS